MVDANGDDLMKKINRVAAEMRANASPTNKKDLGKEALPTCGIEGPAKAKEGRIVGGVEAEEHAWPWQVDLSLSLCICICICSSSTLCPGRWLSSSMTPGSAAAPSSPRTTS